MHIYNSRPTRRGSGFWFNVVTIVVIVYTVASILEGWALSILWRWFVVPATVFHPLSVAQAIGIAITVNMLTATSAKDENDGTFLLTLFLRPIIVLAIGWIVFQFVH